MRKLIPSLALTIAFGVAGFAGILSGCSDSQESRNLLTNPDQAHQSDKGASTLGGVDPDPVPVDDESYSGVCDDAGADANAICATIRFHQISPPAKHSTYVNGTHLTTEANYSKYDIGGGVIIEHNVSWGKYSKYTRAKAVAVDVVKD